MKRLYRYCYGKTTIWPLVISMACSLWIAGTAAAADDTIDMGLPPWPGVTIKSEVVAEILKPLGYQVKFTHANAPIVYLSLAKGDVDVNLSAWSPGQAPSFEPFVKKGKIIKLGHNLTGATSGFAVPDYVYASGLQSDTQLPKFAQRFDHKIYCIEPGSGADNIVQKGIKNNIYGLQNWTMQPNSTAVMLAQVKRAIEHKSWIVFCGWRPHWMVIALPIKFLKDPRSLWARTKAIAKYSPSPAPLSSSAIPISPDSSVISRSIPKPRVNGFTVIHTNISTPPRWPINGLPPTSARSAPGSRASRQKAEATL